MKKTKDIFREIVPELKKQKFNIDIDKFLDFIGHYDFTYLISPSEVQGKLKISIVDTYKLLEFLAQHKYLEPVIPVYCPYCNAYSGYYYDTIGEIPNKLTCLYCKQEISDPLQTAVIFYKIPLRKQDIGY